jgi:hypothetical protein
MSGLLLATSRAEKHYRRMDVRLLVIENCPHAGTAAALLRRALDDVGLSRVPFRTETVTNQEVAADLHFLGSPTVLINGKDPFDEPGRQPALACRVYRSAQGLLGLPELDSLRKALKQAVDSAQPPHRC